MTSYNQLVLCPQCKISILSYTNILLHWIRSERGTFTHLLIRSNAKTEIYKSRKPIISLLKNS